MKQKSHRVLSLLLAVIIWLSLADEQEVVTSTPASTTPSVLVYNVTSSCFEPVAPSATEEGVTSIYLSIRPSGSTVMSQVAALSRYDAWTWVVLVVGKYPAP